MIGLQAAIRRQAKASKGQGAAEIGSRGARKLQPHIDAAKNKVLHA
jgi:hypothetical protein